MAKKTPPIDPRVQVALYLPGLPQGYSTNLRGAASTVPGWPNFAGNPNFDGVSPTLGESPTLASGRFGWSSSFDGGDRIDTGVLNTNYAGGGTIFWSLYPALLHNDGTIHGIWGQTTGTTVPELTCQKFTDSNFYVGWNRSGDSDRVVVAATQINYRQNAWNDYAFVWFNGGPSILYHKGKEIGRNAGPTTTSTFTGNDRFFIGRKGGAAQTYQGRIDYFYIMNIPLSPDVINALYLSPLIQVPNDPSDVVLEIFSSPPPATLNQNRMSMLNVSCPWRGPLVNPLDVGFTQGNRQAADFIYSGILAAGAPAGGSMTWDAGSYTITGQAISGTVETPFEAGSYAISGQAISGTVETPFEAGFYAISGADLTGTVEMPWTAGSYAVAEADLGLLAAYMEALDPGSYVISGPALQGETETPVDAGSYALSGAALSLTADYATSIDAGNYSVSGAALNLLADYAESLDAGAYLIFGVDFELSLVLTPAVCFVYGGRQVFEFGPRSVFVYGGRSELDVERCD